MPPKIRKINPPLTKHMMEFGYNYDARNKILTTINIYLFRHFISQHYKQYYSKS